jgi:hypothetical protein
MAKFDLKSKVTATAERIQQSASKPKPSSNKTIRPSKSGSGKKKFAKYSNGTFVNSELIKPKLQEPNTAYLNIEEELDALAKANKIRLAISSSLGGVLTLLVLGYSMLAGSYGFFDFSGGKFVTYPAFVAESKMKGGFIRSEGVKVYASIDSPAPEGFFSKIQTGYTGVSNRVIAEVMSIDYSSQVIIQDGTISIFNGVDARTIDGVYSGGVVGEYTLKKQYIMKCISGSCKTGELILVSVDNIVGLVD